MASQSIQKYDLLTVDSDIEYLSADHPLVHEMPGVLGSYIRKIRMSKGLRQGELAKEMGVSQPTVSKLEQGANVKVLTLMTALHYLGLLEKFRSLLPDTPQQGLSRLRFKSIEEQDIFTAAQVVDLLEFNEDKEFKVKAASAVKLRKDGFAVRRDDDKLWYVATIKTALETKEEQDWYISDDHGYQIPLVERRITTEPFGARSTMRANTPKKTETDKKLLRNSIIDRLLERVEKEGIEVVHLSDAMLLDPWDESKYKKFVEGSLDTRTYLNLLRPDTLVGLVSRF